MISFKSYHGEDKKKYLIFTWFSNSSTLYSIYYRMVKISPSKADLYHRRCCCVTVVSEPRRRTGALADREPFSPKCLIIPPSLSMNGGGGGGGGYTLYHCIVPLPLTLKKLQVTRPMCMKLAAGSPPSPFSFLLYRE